MTLGGRMSWTGAWWVQLRDPNPVLGVVPKSEDVCPCRDLCGNICNSSVRCSLTAEIPQTSAS